MTSVGDSARTNFDGSPRTVTSAVEVLVWRIRDLIDESSLGVGDNLPSERELCETFATSRNTVREAMRMLKAYGIVTVRPKVGAILTDNRMERVFDLFSFNTLEVSRETFIDIQGFRSLLEVGAVDDILDNVVPEDIDELYAINEAMRTAENFELAADIDFRFHLRLIGVLHNRAVRDIYRIIKPVIMRIIETGKVLDDFRHITFEQHQAIVDALKAHNRIAYQFALKSHLESGLANFRELEVEKN